MNDKEIKRLKVLAFDLREQRKYHREEVYNCTEELQEVEEAIEKLSYPDVD